MWYDLPGNPSAVFDGWESEAGGLSEGSMFSRYDPYVAAHLLEPSPLQIRALYSVSGQAVTLDVQVTVKETVITSNAVVEFVVVEDSAYGGVNLARMVLDSEPFDLTEVGQTMTVSRGVWLNTGWVRENVGFVVFVQDRAGDKEVLQATRAVPDSTVFVFIETEPDSLYPPWQLEGPGDLIFSGRGDEKFNLPDEGSYTLTWLAVPWWTSPSPAIVGQVAAEGDTLTFEGIYTDPPLLPDTSGPLGNTGQGRGVSCVDFDQDGDLDIYVVNYNQPNLLLRNEGDRIFVDATTGVLTDPGPGVSGLWADFDNDGDPDLYLSRENAPNILLRNDQGVFLDVTPPPLGDSGPGAGVSCSDFDNDGLLDIYLVNEGTENKLFKNYGEISGQWLWLPVTGNINNTGAGRNAAWADYDNDGDSDLYLTNRGQPNVLLQNNGTLGFFVQSGTGFLADQGDGSGVAWGDFNNDGRQDLYVVNDGQRDLLARNEGGSFSLQVSSPLGDAGNGQAVIWTDFDNDGYLDIFLSRCGQMISLLQNIDGQQFAKAQLVFPGADGCTSGAASGDFDGDGDQDIYVAYADGPNVLLWNEIENSNHWLQVMLRGVTSNASAVGAQIKVVANGMAQYRQVAAGSGNLSQNSAVAAFGLGSYLRVDSLMVRWPSGNEDVWTNISADRMIVIEEGSNLSIQDPDTPEDLADPANPDSTPMLGLILCHPNPFNPNTTIMFSVDRSRRVNISVFDMMGKCVVLIADRIYGPGTHSVDWGGEDTAGRHVSCGTYLVRMETEYGVESKKVVLVR